MRLGAGAEVRVGLFMPRGIGAVVGMLGILRSGAAYVPLDPDVPATTTAAIVADAGLTLMVGERGRATAAGLSQIDLDTEGRCAAPAASLARLPSLDPRQLMYAIYTSGSTGGPKGVLVEHGQVARLFPAIAEQVRFDERDVWTQIHSLVFGFSVWEIWGALAHGGTLLGRAARDRAGAVAAVRAAGIARCNRAQPDAFGLSRAGAQRPGAA